MATASDTLSTWNEARSIASDLLPALTADEVPYDDLTTQYPTVDFPDEATLSDLSTTLADQPNPEAVNTLARHVQDWLQRDAAGLSKPEQSADTTSETAGTDESTEDVDPILSDWNAARSVAATIITEIDDGEFDRDAVASERTATVPPAETIRERVAATAGTKTERINDLARWILDWESQSWDVPDTPSPDTQTTSQATTSQEAQDTDQATTADASEAEAENISIDIETQTDELAQALIECFVDYEKNYREVETEFADEFEFPPRHVVQLKVVNTPGDRQERHAELVAWITEWEHMDFESERRRKPYRPIGRAR